MFFSSCQWLVVSSHTTRVGLASSLVLGLALSQTCMVPALSSEDKALRVFPGEGTWGILGMRKGCLPHFPVLLLFIYFLKFKLEQCDLLNSLQAAGCLVSG